jgi:hypothetical protein
MGTKTITLILAVVFLQHAYSQENQMLKEGTRQIHLDFHTSGIIEHIGTDFSKEQFKEALVVGNVNSINIFAKGHHGYSYYNTELGTRHPHLDFDLFKAQLDACHELGITAQAYFTVGWSVKDAEDHPEWVLKDKDGSTDKIDIINSLGPDDPLPNYAWKLLAPSNGYDEYILKQVEEICLNYDLDGFWFDILQAYPNYSETNKAAMLAGGIDIEDDQAVLDYSMNQMTSFMDRCNKLIKKHKPNIPVYYNGITNLSRQNNLKYNLFDYNTKQDLEDLPTTWGGYDIFPYRSKFFAADGKQIVAMSGKFHSAWGEFGGFKHRDALLYEAASMVAFGAHVNIGDQLHPSGKMDMTTYENIGFAFDYVEQIEEYGVDALHISRLGYFNPLNSQSGEGTVRMMLEEQVNFNVINRMEDWSELEAIVIPSESKLNPELVSRLQSFVDRGGKLLIMGQAVLNPKDHSPWFDVGADFVGKANYDVDYTVVGDQLEGELVKSPFLNYTAALRFKPKEGTEVLAAIKEPYFSRTRSHFCSHRNTPNQLENADHPAIIRKGNIVYVAHALDLMYVHMGARVHRDIFNSTLNLVHERPMVKADLQSSGRINLLHQPDKSRYVLHLLYATPIQRGDAQVIEDLIPIYNTEVEIDLPVKVKKAYTIPGNQEVKLEYTGDVAKALIPEFTAHIALVLEYE